MKAKRLTVRRINQRRHTLPEETNGRDLLLMRVKARSVVERTLYHNYPEQGGSFVVGFTHYIVLPNWLR